MITGWRAVEEFTGLKEHHLRRAIGHYGFPKPVPMPLARSGDTKMSITNVWSKKEVLAWLHLTNTYPQQLFKRKTNHLTKGESVYGSNE